MLEYCFYVGVALTIFAIPLLIVDQDPERDREAGTAGAWNQLNLWTALCDVGLVCVLLYFFHAGSLYLMDPDEQEEQNPLSRIANAVSERIAKRISAAETALELTLPARLSESIAVPLGLSRRVPAAMSAEKASVESVRPMLAGTHLVEGTSLVVCGWGRGVPMPSALFEAVVRTAGEAPVRAVQPTACLSADEAHKEAARAQRALEIKKELLMRAQQTSRGASDRSAALAALTAEVAARQLDVDVASAAVPRAEAECRAQPLHYAFFTFSSSTPKSAVLMAASTRAPREHRASRPIRLLLPQIHLPTTAGTRTHSHVQSKM
jgi:hypothetical protein